MIGRQTDKLEQIVRLSNVHIRNVSTYIHPANKTVKTIWIFLSFLFEYINNIPQNRFSNDNSETDDNHQADVVLDININL